MTSLKTLSALFGPAESWPDAFKKLGAVQLILSGVPEREAVKRLHTTLRAVEPLLAAPDIDAAFFGDAEPTPEVISKTRNLLGNILVGDCAEVAFADIYKREMNTPEFQLVDDRANRSDTDFRVLNGGGRPVYRINIKFHGSLFRSAVEYVGLQPDDCFALATYKIQSALKKQEVESLPYLFVIVSAGGTRAADVGAQLPEEFVRLLALMRVGGVPGIRDVEERVVSLLRETKDPLFKSTHDQIEQGKWYVLSAVRANNLLHEKLFERVPALMVRNFTSLFRGAEVDMHFSLSSDLTKLTDYLKTFREEGSHKITSLLASGKY